MKKIVLLAFMSLGVASIMSLSVVGDSAYAQVSSGINAATTDEMKNKQIDGSNGVIRTVSNILIWVVGFISVIMIMWSGFKYATAAGDTSKVASAKNSLIYAIVGLIIAVLAYAIVNFIMDRLNVSSGKSSGGSLGGASAGGASAGGAAAGSSPYAEERRKAEAAKKREAEERKREAEEKARRMKEERERARRGAGGIFGG